jgi:hypothetical protein
VNNGAILEPMLAMMVLTGLVWVVLYARRIPAMQAARRPVQSYTTPETIIEVLPEAINYPAYNLKNLFELPVLFYALCLLLYVTGEVDGVTVAVAWGFVVFRALHSVIHCTVNRVMARFVCYLISSILLWIMLIRAAIEVFGS